MSLLVTVSNSDLALSLLKTARRLRFKFVNKLIFPTFQENENVVRFYGLIYFMMSFSLS